MNKYTSRYAEGYVEAASKVTWLNLLFNPVSAFIKWYFFKKNFLDGLRGFILGNYAALYTFLKYVKLYHIKTNKDSARSGKKE